MAGDVMLVAEAARVAALSPPNEFDAAVLSWLIMRVGPSPRLSFSSECCHPTVSDFTRSFTDDALGHGWFADVSDVLTGFSGADELRHRWAALFALPTASPHWKASRSQDSH